MSNNVTCELITDKQGLVCNGCDLKRSMYWCWQDPNAEEIRSMLAILSETLGHVGCLDEPE